MTKSTLTPHQRLLAGIHIEAAAFFECWEQGDRETAKAMIPLVDTKHLPYFITCAAFMAIGVDRRMDFYRFIKQMTV